MKAPVISLVAYSGTGKTTFLEKLLPCLRALGLRTAVIKHDGHDFQMDTPGTDTFRLAKAGAGAVAIVSSGNFALLEQRGPSVEEIAGMLKHTDLILTEGFKRGPYPKIALYRAGSGLPLAVEPEACLAVAADVPIQASCPVFPLSDAKPLAEFLAELVKGKQEETSHADHC